MTLQEGSPVQDPSKPGPDAGLVFALPPDVEGLPVLVRYRSGVDIIRKPPAPGRSWNGSNIKGLGYELACFAAIASQPRILTEDGRSLYAFGPGVIEAALRSSLDTLSPNTSLPDGIGVEIIPNAAEGSSSVLALARLYEDRTDRINPSAKLALFTGFTKKLRENPELFSSHMADAMAGAGHLFQLVVPPDEEIVVEFISPRGYVTGVLRSSGYPFPIKYSSIPLTPLEASNAA